MQLDSPEQWTDRYGREPRKGADVLVQALEREGCRRVFAYPGGASLEIHQALTRSPLIRNILCRHEQVCPAAEVAADCCPALRKTSNRAAIYVRGLIWL